MADNFVNIHWSAAALGWMHLPVRLLVPNMPQHLKYLIITLKLQVKTEFTHSLPQIISPHEIAAHHLDIFIYMFHQFHIFSHDFPIFPISPRLNTPFPARLHHEAAIRATAGLGEQLLRKPGDCGGFRMGFSAEIAADLEVYSV